MFVYLILTPHRVLLQFLAGGGACPGRPMTPREKTGSDIDNGLPLLQELEDFLCHLAKARSRHATRDAHVRATVAPSHLRPLGRGMPGAGGGGGVRWARILKSRSSDWDPIPAGHKQVP